MTSNGNPTDPRRRARYVSGYLHPDRANERVIGLATLFGALRAALRRR
jgi:hypothetical protein